VGTDEKRPALCGVNIRRVLDRMEYSATNGVIFLMVDIPVAAKDQSAAVFPETTVKTCDWRAGLEYMTADKNEQTLHPDAVMIFLGERVEIINATSETIAEISAVPVAGKFSASKEIIPKYEVMEDMSGSAAAQKKVAGRALVDPDALAALLKTVGKMATSGVVIEVPLSPMEPLIVRAVGPVEDSRITGVLLAGL
jgi:hypothetical protein